MKLWIIQVGELVPGVDGPVRPARCALLADAAVQAGHSVVRWASTFRHQDRQPRAESERNYAFGDRLEVRLVHGRGYRHNRSISRFFHHREEAAALLRQAGDLPRPDLVFCCLPTPQLCRASIAYGAAQNVPVVLDVRDLWPDHYLTFFPLALRPWVKPLLAGEYRALRRLLGRAAGLTAISEAYFQWSMTHAGRAARSTDGIFPLGYPAPASEPGEVEAVARAARTWREKLKLRDEELKVAFVGSFVSSFDFHTVIEAARRLQTAGRPVRFLFTGSGGFEAEMRRDAQGLDNLDFLGWVQDRHELAGLLEVADVGLSPYRRGCTMSLPNKPFEYMAAARPQVSSLEGELAAIIQRERIGLNYVADDAAALAGALERLLAQPAERRQMGTNARALFDRDYSSAVIYPRLVRHLEAVARSAA